MKQLLLIVNPVAGMRKTAKHLADIINVFNRADYDVHTYITDKQFGAAHAIKNKGKDMDLIVCCGGDGTLNDTINGVIENDLYVPLGYIPAGSTNDFASSLGLSGDLVASAKQIVNGTPRLYDVGKFGDRYFAYVASTGAFTKASYSAPQTIKNALGHTAYLLEGMQELSKIKNVHLRVETENDILEDDYLFCAICNSTSIGGVLTLNPKLVDMGDGLFEILLIRAPRNIQELSDCVTALSNQTYNCGMVAFRSAKKIKVKYDADLLWSLDGEKAEGMQETEIENIQQRIMLIH